MRPIALYEPGGEKLNFYCRMCEPIIWQGTPFFIIVTVSINIWLVFLFVAI